MTKRQAFVPKWPTQDQTKSLTLPPSAIWLLFNHIKRRPHKAKADPPLSIFWCLSFRPPKQANQRQQAQAQWLAACVWSRGAEAPWFGGATALPMERERAKPLEGTKSCQKGQIQICSLANYGDRNISPRINWFKIALQIKLQFDLWHEIVFWWTYGTFCGPFWTLGLVYKGKHEIFSIKICVGNKTLCIDKIWWTADTWYARYRR